MRRIYRTAMGMVLMMASAGCAANAGAATIAAGGSGASNAPAAEGAPTVEITDTVRLIVGTMNLGEAGLAPDAVEATELVTLWQAYRSLAASDTTAPKELEAVLAQIRGTMTAEQLAAIDSMVVTQDEVRALFDSFRQAGGGFQDGASRGQPDGEFPAGGGFGPFAGGGERGFAGPPAGGGPGGGGFPPGGDQGGLDPQQLATVQAQRANRAQDPNQAGRFLIAPLIEYLQTLAGTT